DELAPEDLEERLAAYRASLRERSESGSELGAHEQEIAALVRRLGPSLPTGIAPGTEALVKKLAVERAGLDANLGHAERALVEIEAELAANGRRLEGMPVARSLATLEVLVATTPAAELESRVTRLAAERDRVKALATARLAALGLGAMTLD